MTLHNVYYYVLWLKEGDIAKVDGPFDHEVALRHAAETSKGLYPLIYESTSPEPMVAAVEWIIDQRGGTTTEYGGEG